MLDYIDTQPAQVIEENGLTVMLRKTSFTRRFHTKERKPPAAAQVAAASGQYFQRVFGCSSNGSGFNLQHRELNPCSAAEVAPAPVGSAVAHALWQVHLTPVN